MTTPWHTLAHTIRSFFGNVVDAFLFWGKSISRKGHDETVAATQIHKTTTKTTTPQPLRWTIDALCGFTCLMPFTHTCMCKEHKTCKFTKCN